MINSELLKEAIADAKAVRATALANAKAALEEAFAPRFEAMFAEKLKEESEEQEEMVAEVEAPNQVTGKGGEAKGPKTKAVSKGNPKTPASAAGDKDFKPVKAGKGPADVANPSKKVNETAEEEEEEGKKMDEVAEEEQEEAKDESVNPAGSVNEFGLTSEDLDEIIKELEAEVAGEEEGQKEPAAEFPPVPAPAPEGEPVAGAEEVPHAEPDGDEGQPPVDVAAEPGSDVQIDVGPEAGAEEVPAAPVAPEGDPAAVAAPAPVAPHGDEDENIDLEELLAALNEESEEEEEEGKSMDESENHGVPKSDLKGQDKAGGVKGYPSAPQDASKKQLKGKNHNISGHGNIGTGAVGGKPMEEQYKVALTEAYKTIEFLRGQINEVNLLNAKLLYTNKLFKEFAGVLDDQYRLKIVENFDLTKSVREVKLAYALLAESLNFGAQVARTQKNAAKTASKPAPTATKGNVKQITEGLASKPVASTKPAQVITENVNEMALRFKKLAGIKEAPKASEKK